MLQLPLFGQVGLLDTISKKYQDWKDDRFLHNHGCDNWDQYHRIYDPDYHPRATQIRDYYHGYPNWTLFKDHNHIVYHWDLGYDGMYVISQWCKENLKGKFRFDYHRVINCPATAWQWEINELGGSDYIFFACKDPEDFFIFKLKWGG